MKTLAHGSQQPRESASAPAPMGSDTTINFGAASLLVLTIAGQLVALSLAYSVATVVELVLRKVTNENDSNDGVGFMRLCRSKGHGENCAGIEE